MSVEELAEFIDSGDECGFCNQFGVDTGRECDGDCVECIKHWLGLKTFNNRPQRWRNKKALRKSRKSVDVINLICYNQ